MATRDKLIARCRELAALMDSLREDVTQAYATEGEVGDDIKVTMEGSLARLAKVIIGKNVHKKIDEIAYAAENPQLGVTVNPVPHGHDFVDAEGRRCELKVSTTSAPKRRSNVNWAVPSGATEAERRAKLLASIRNKVGDGGYARIIIKDGNQKTLFEYTLDGGFLMTYFNEITLGCGTHNMGCTACKDCGSFHRLDAIQDASNKWCAGKDMQIDWAPICRGRIPSNCGRKVAH